MPGPEEERARALFEERALSGAWSGLYRGPKNLARHPFQARLQAVEAMLDATPSVGRVLDVGAGSCDFGPAVRDRGGSYVALDTSAAMLKLGRVHVDEALRLCVGAAEGLPFAAGSFDTVLALGLLGFLPDPPRAVLEIARVLSPAGTLIVQGGQRDLWSRIRNRRGQAHGAAGSLERPVSWRELERTLAPLGFRVQMRRWIDFVPFPRRLRGRLPRLTVATSEAMARCGPVCAPLARSHVTQYMR